MSQQLHSHIVLRDQGLAPNPFGGYLTLACTQADMRRTAQVGDWLMGTGAPRGIGELRLIYAARIDEKLSLQQYRDDQRFQFKIPGPHYAPWGWRGDNLFQATDNGQWQTSDSEFYDLDQLAEDVLGENVLISREFWYFGISAPLLPKRFKDLLQQGRNYKTISHQPMIKDFLGWLSLYSEPGLLDKPARQAPL